MSRHAPRLTPTLLEARQSLERTGLTSALRRAGCLWRRSCSLQHLPAALCRSSGHARNDPATTFFHRPTHVGKRHSSSRFSLPWRFLSAGLAASKAGETPAPQKSPSAACHSSQMFLVCLCAVSGTLRGLSQPGRDFVPPTLMGFFPSQCFSGPRVSAPFGVSGPQSSSRCAVAAHVFGRAIRCCGSRRRVCDLAGFGPAGKLC
jgi:hypothetical protein